MKHSIAYRPFGAARTRALFALAWICGGPIASGQGTAFTYQGRLTDGGGPASGIYDLRFTIYDLANGGSAVAGSRTNSAVTVSNGLFTVALDFGAGVFNGADRWLEIGVRAYDGAAFTTLSPRQPITPTPYAIRAANFSGPVAASQLTGIISPGHIGAGSIDATKLAAGAVTSAALANGAVAANKLAAGAVGSVQLADGAVTAAKVFSVTNRVVLTLTNPIPEQADSFGSALAALGNDRFLIGSPNASKAYLFNFYGRLLHTFADSGPFASSSTFGSSVAAVGIDRVLIGARTQTTSATAGASGAGAAHLYTANGVLLTTITNPTPASNDEFGSALAVVGNSHVLIGAHNDDTSATNAGIAYLFNTNGALLTTFTNPVPVAGDDFGISVAAVGNRVVIGDSGNDTGATNAGAAYLFSTNGTLLTTFTNPLPASGDEFGFTLAAVGTDRVLIGATFGDAGGVNAGAAYLFSTSGALLTTFTNPSPSGNDFFGAAVAAMGSDRVLIGAQTGDEGGFNIGAVYLYSTNGTLLATFANPTPAQNDHFGLALTAVGDRVLISNVGNDTGALNTGAAYLFSSEMFMPGLVAAEVRDGAITSASIAEGAVTSDQLADGAVTAMKLDPAIGVWTRTGDSVFRPAGNVGIGTANPQALLHVNGTMIWGGNTSDYAYSGQDGSGLFIEQKGTSTAKSRMRFQSSKSGDLINYSQFNIDPNNGFSFLTFGTGNGKVGIGRIPAANALEVEGNASKNAAGSWLMNSDARIKTGVRTITGALDKLSQVRLVEFHYTADFRAQHPGIKDRSYLNVVAQEFQKVFPEDVQSSGEKLPDGEAILQVDTYPLTIYSAAAIQELNQKLERKLEQKETEIMELKARLEKLEQRLNQPTQNER